MLVPWRVIHKATRYGNVSVFLHGKSAVKLPKERLDLEGGISIVTFVCRRALSRESYLPTPKLQFTSAIRPFSKTILFYESLFFLGG